MVLNDEIDSLDTVIVFDWCVYRNTRGELQNEIWKIRKDTAKVRHLLDTQE